MPDRPCTCDLTGRPACQAHAVLEDRPQFGTPEHTAAWFRRYPHRRGMSGDQQRQSAQADTGAAMHAARRGDTCPTILCTWPTTEHRHDPGHPVPEPTWRA